MRIHDHVICSVNHFFECGIVMTDVINMGVCKSIALPPWNETREACLYYETCMRICVRYDLVSTCWPTGRPAICPADSNSQSPVLTGF